MMIMMTMGRDNNMARDMVRYRNGDCYYWKVKIFEGIALRCIGIFGTKGESISMGGVPEP